MISRAAIVTRDFEKASDTITLDESARHRRRVRMVSDVKKIEFMLDLPQARLLRSRDGLVLEDGTVIEVRAQPEPLYEVTGTDSRHLLVLAWQLGNRHLSAQILKERILVRRDPVIRTMLEGLGATVSEIEAPFDPEGGAYAHSRESGHHHHE